MNIRLCTLSKTLVNVNFYFSRPINSIRLPSLIWQYTNAAWSHVTHAFRVWLYEAISLDLFIYFWSGVGFFFWFPFGPSRELKGKLNDEYIYEKLQWVDSHQPFRFFRYFASNTSQEANTHYQAHYLVATPYWTVTLVQCYDNKISLTACKTIIQTPCYRVFQHISKHVHVLCTYTHPPHSHQCSKFILQHKPLNSPVRACD